MAARKESDWGRLIVAVAALLAGGCFGPAESKYARQLVPAAGRISVGGQPLADATVIFVPADGGAGTVGATAFTAADGRFKAITPLPNTDASRCVGLIPGRYRVVLRKLAMPNGTPVPTDIEESEALARGARNALPGRYGTAENTPLAVDVPEGGVESLDLEVTR